MDKQSLLEALSPYTFYQTVDLGDGVSTPGLPVDAKQRQVLKYIGDIALKGKRAIDIGCANGLFTLALERGGAAEVYGVDHTQRNIDCLNKVILPHLNSRIAAVQANMLDMTRDTYGAFDVVVFGGVLYHLRYPFLALRIVRDIIQNGGTMILETGIFDDFNRRALLYCPGPKDTPFKGRFANSCSFFNERAINEALAYFGFRVREQVIVNQPVKRFAKKVWANLSPGYYPVSNIVMLCERDSGLDDRPLIEFYESMTR